MRGFAVRSFAVRDAAVRDVAVWNMTIADVPDAILRNFLIPYNFLLSLEASLLCNYYCPMGCYYLLHSCHQLLSFHHYRL